MDPQKSDVDAFKASLLTECSEAGVSCEEDLCTNLVGPCHFPSEKLLVEKTPGKRRHSDNRKEVNFVDGKKKPRLHKHCNERASSSGESGSSSEKFPESIVKTFGLGRAHISESQDSNKAVDFLSPEGKVRKRRRKRGQRKNRAGASVSKTEVLQKDASKSVVNDSKILGNGVENLTAGPVVGVSDAFPVLLLTSSVTKVEKINKEKNSNMGVELRSSGKSSFIATTAAAVVPDVVKSNSVSLKSLTAVKLSPPSTNVSKQKPERYKFIHGNYNRYYGYRNPELEADPRLSCLPPLLFEGQEVLDIGCNIGHVTLLIARDWRPKRIVGIDIDGKLIKVAKKNVQHYTDGHVRTKNLNSMLGSCVQRTTSSSNSASSNSKSQMNAFPNNVMFLQGNYVLERDEMVDLQGEEYDIILALSISKWIHLNFGDDGLKRAFRRMFCQLRCGGKLIFEPQEWSSYKRRKHLTDKIYENYQAIRFRPEQFRSYLLSKHVGFSSCEILGISDNKSKGFRRPLLMFTKSSCIVNPEHFAEGVPSANNSHKDGASASMDIKDNADAPNTTALSTVTLNDVASKDDDSTTENIELDVATITTGYSSNDSGTPVYTTEAVVTCSSVAMRYCSSDIDLPLTGDFTSSISSTFNENKSSCSEICDTTSNSCCTSSKTYFCNVSLASSVTSLTNSVASADCVASTVANAKVTNHVHPNIVECAIPC